MISTRRAWREVRAQVAAGRGSGRRVPASAPAGHRPRVATRGRQRPIRQELLQVAGSARLSAQVSFAVEPAPKITIDPPPARRCT